MSKEDNYTNRVTKCFNLLSELLTKYPRSIDEVEEELLMNLEFYKDLANYVLEEKIESKPIMCKILPTKLRPPIVMDYYFDDEDEVSPLALDLED